MKILNKKIRKARNRNEWKVSFQFVPKDGKLHQVSFIEKTSREKARAMLNFRLRGITQSCKKVEIAY